MLDFSWSELVLIGIIALVAIGPKELPGVLRAVGQWMGKARKMAAEFQSQFQEAMREAASGLSGGNLISSLQKDVTNSLRIDDVDKLAETPATPAIEPLVTPTV